MRVTLISGMVVPHWKFTLIAASMVPRVTAGNSPEILRGLRELFRSEKLHLDLTIGAILHVGAKPSRSLVMWWAGGTRCEMRITTVCAVANEATKKLATAKTQPMRVCGFIGFHPADVTVM